MVIERSEGKGSWWSQCRRQACSQEQGWGERGGMPFPLKGDAFVGKGEVSKGDHNRQLDRIVNADVFLWGGRAIKIELGA